MFRRFCSYWDAIESFHSLPFSFSLSLHLFVPFLGSLSFFLLSDLVLASSRFNPLSCSSFLGSFRRGRHFILLAGGDRPRFAKAYVLSSCFSLPCRLKFPRLFFLVLSCVPPHNYRNDSVNSRALSPRSSSRPGINLT